MLRQTARVQIATILLGEQKESRFHVVLPVGLKSARLACMRPIEDGMSCEFLCGELFGNASLQTDRQLWLISNGTKKNQLGVWIVQA
jgi:hypothetical protein